MIQFHQLSTAEVLGKLETDTRGLDEDKVLRRRRQYGWNELPNPDRRPLWKGLLKQFRNLFVIILLLAAVISYAMDHILDVYVILVVVLANATIGFIHEVRADMAIRSLQGMFVPRARAIRGGKLIPLAVRDLVPGDIIVLEEGEGVPADARIIESSNLRTIEASLTGESLPVSKQEAPLPTETPLAERKNMVWKGTFVAGGYALAVVCGTGLDTAIGNIAASLSTIRPKKANFQKKTDRLARQMAFLAIFSTMMLFLTAYFLRSFSLEELLSISIAAMVSAIPEGLPAVLSIVLAIGSKRMSRKQAVIRDLNSVETLGSVSTIITDKTGTLTQNKLTVKKISVAGLDEFELSGEGWFPAGNFHQQQAVVDPADYPTLCKLLQIAACSNNATVRHDAEQDTYELLGDPTEGALLVMARKAGVAAKQDNGSVKLDDLPFDSKRKLRATLTKDGTDTELLVVGAPEQLLARSHHLLTPQGVMPLEKIHISAIQQKISEWSGDALRVIGMAYREMTSDMDVIDENRIDTLVFAGVVGMIDPARPEARGAVVRCRRAGIRVIMATGDHINTAIAIAKLTGIINGQQQHHPVALTEQQLTLLDGQEFDDAIRTVDVFARLTPAMKLRIAERIQAMGQLVAMTGDGVNDAPALKQADVGVAMGVMGTDVARDAARVVLADDNFATIVNAVEEGRIVFANARHTSFFLITTNVAEIVTLITFIAMGYPIPLTAIQILWLNLVTDGVGDIALATEKGHGDELEAKPIPKKEPIMNGEVIPFLVIISPLMAILCLVVYFSFIGHGLAKARTAVFVTMALTQLFNLLNMRSLKKTVFEIGYFTNTYINIALVASLIIQVTIIELPIFQRIFDFRSITFVEFMLLAALSSLVLWAGEFYKFVRSRLPKY